MLNFFTSLVANAGHRNKENAAQNNRHPHATKDLARKPVQLGENRQASEGAGDSRKALEVRLHAGAVSIAGRGAHCFSRPVPIELQRCVCLRLNVGSRNLHGALLPHP